MAKQEFSTLTLTEQLRTEANAYELLERLRWDGNPVCPHCGTVGYAYFLEPRDGTESRATRTGSLRSGGYGNAASVDVALRLTRI